MSEQITVLKFGSSVLADESALPAAVLEIYREVRKNRRVVAVVSALGETTDVLLKRAQRNGCEPEPYSLAHLLETGEAESAALLGLALGEVGLPCEIVDAKGIGLVTVGEVLDAEPSDLDTERLHQILTKVPVVVVPGFCGVDEQQRTTLLGRGGSDLTAMFLAQKLGAVECRLLKDVDGLLRVKADGTLDYTTRYATAHYDECLRVGGPLIQPKAVEFAARHGQSFAVAKCGSASGTLAGPAASRYEKIPAQRPRLRVALAGLGTVGLGVLRWLLTLPDEFELTGILVGDTSRERASDVPVGLLIAQWPDLLASNPEVVIEAIGGTEVAAELIAAARLQGLGVVTANKQLLATDRHLLREASLGKSPMLNLSACVGGGMTALEHTALKKVHEEVVAVSGVLNGTCNFVLERMQSGMSRQEAVTEAQMLGLAEADPHLDVSGLDSVYKLSLLASLAFDELVSPEDIDCTGLALVSDKQVLEARQSGQVVKLIAEARRLNGRIVARVSPRTVSPNHPLASCEREGNRLVIESVGGQEHILSGKGAGRWPTTCSILSDVLEMRRKIVEPDRLEAPSSSYGVA